MRRSSLLIALPISILTLPGIAIECENVRGDPPALYLYCVLLVGDFEINGGLERTCCNRAVSNIILSIGSFF